MKKEYSTPDIVYESYNLSTSVAACAVETNFSEYICGYEVYPGFVIFKVGVDGCLNQIQDSAFGDKICYDNPSGLLNLFSS